MEQSEKPNLIFLTMGRVWTGRAEYAHKTLCFVTWTGGESNLRVGNRDHNNILTSSLPQSVKFLGSKVHAYTCKQYIFQSSSKSTFNIVHFDENSFTC